MYIKLKIYLKINQKCFNVQIRHTNFAMCDSLYVMDFENSLQMSDKYDQSEYCDK